MPCRIRPSLVVNATPAVFAPTEFQYSGDVDVALTDVADAEPFVVAPEPVRADLIPTVHAEPAVFAPTVNGDPVDVVLGTPVWAVPFVSGPAVGDQARYRLRARDGADPLWIDPQEGNL